MSQFLSKCKDDILQAMIDLIRGGETLCADTEGDFSEFAHVNNFDLETVQLVYAYNKEYLETLYCACNGHFL